MTDGPPRPNVLACTLLVKNKYRRISGLDTDEWAGKQKDVNREIR